MRDVQALFWLRWRQFKDTAVYWLRVLGYRPQDASLSQNLYVLYLLLIALFWVYTVSAFVYDSALGIGRLIEATTAGEVLIGFTVALLILQVYVMVNALQSTPLKLSFADMAYVAGAPISRAAPVIVGFVRQVALRLFIISIPVLLIGVLVGRALLPHDVGGAALRLTGATLPVIVLFWALGWALGLTRLINPRIGKIRFLWLLPLLLLPAAYFFPDFVLWIGRIPVLVMLGESPVWALPLLVLLAAVTVGITFWLGNRINMIHAVDESILYARIQALGLLAWRMFDVQARIRMQARQASRKPFLSLPNAQGNAIFYTRAALSYVRHPFMLLMCFAWGWAMTSAAVQTVVGQPPIQIWILLVVIAGIIPPFGLLHVFEADQRERFLRQFLPVDGLQLLIADILVPLIALIAGGGVALVGFGFPPEIFSMSLIFLPVCALLVALCGAVALTSNRVLQTRLLATGLSFGAVILAGTQLQTPFAALGAAALAILVLSGMVGTNA